MLGSLGAQTEVFQVIADQWGAWMRNNKVREVVVEIEAVGTRAKITSHVLHPRGILRQPQWSDDDFPTELANLAMNLRAVMGSPRGGTWTWARLSMSSAQDYKLLSDFDYNREPTLNPPYTAQDLAKERELFPRDPKATPQWMRAESSKLLPWR